MSKPTERFHVWLQTEKETRPDGEFVNREPIKLVTLKTEKLAIECEELVENLILYFYAQARREKNEA